MNASVAVARIMGVALAIAGASLLFNATYFNAVMYDFTHSMGLLWLTGFVTLVCGLVIVSLHNLWVRDWRVLITILAWLTAIKGAAVMVFPRTMMLYQQATGPFLTLGGAFAIMLGLVLLYLGTMGQRHLRNR